MDINKYIDFLLTKWCVFKPDADFDSGNCIDDVQVVIQSVQDFLTRLPNKTTDQIMIEMTERVVSGLVCYDVIDLDFKHRLDPQCAETVFTLFKQYKQSERKKKETCSNLVLNNDLDTHGTAYVCSTDITTAQLRNTFGDLVGTGTECDRFRYEYKYRFTKHGKVGTFSLYDYVNESGAFDDEDDICWHIASDCGKAMTRMFLESLHQKLQAPCC
jgi:hypothetical protein